MADLEHLHPTFRVRAQRAGAATGAAIRSAARTHIEQAELYRCFLAFRNTGRCPCPSGCARANPPGTSNHEWDAADPDYFAAVAVDYTPPPGGFASLHARAAEFGLVFPIAGEPWHAQPVEIPEPRHVRGVLARLPNPPPPVPPPPDPLLRKGRTMLLFDGSVPRFALLTAAGKAVDVAAATIDDGAHVLQWPRTGDPNQLWYMDPVGTGAYRIVASHSGRVLDVAGNGGPGTQLIQWPWNGHPNQIWVPSPVPDSNRFFLVSARGDRSVVEVAGGGSGDGTPIQASVIDGGSAQQFRIVASAGGVDIDFQLA